MDETPDYHEEDVVPVRIGKVCERCSRLLRYKQFERVLIEEQAKKQGYAAQHIVLQEWKICKGCQKELNMLPRPLSGLTPDQIVEAAMKGRVRQQLVAGLVRRALRRTQAKLSEAQARRWAKEWAQPWLYAVDVVATELTRMTSLRKYNKNANPHPTHAAEIVEFIDEHSTLLRALRAHFKDQMRSQEGREQRALLKRAQAQRKAPTRYGRNGKPLGRPRTDYNVGRRDIVMVEDSKWRDYLHPGVWRVLDEKWAALPQKVRAARMSITPLLINEANPLCLTGYAQAKAQAEENPRLQYLLEHQKTHGQPE